MNNRLALGVHFLWDFHLQIFRSCFSSRVPICALGLTSSMCFIVTRLFRHRSLTALYHVPREIEKKIFQARRKLRKVFVIDENRMEIRSHLLTSRERGKEISMFMWKWVCRRHDYSICGKTPFEYFLPFGFLWGWRVRLPFSWVEIRKKQKFEQPSICEIKFNLIARFVWRKKAGVKAKRTKGNNRP